MVNNMEKMNFKVEENGQEVEYNIIKPIHNNANNKDYIVYEKENDENLYASAYRIEGNKLILDAINTDEEWDFIDSIMEEIDYE